MNYEQRYTWQHVYDGRVLIHSDGACSLMVGWEGVDPELIDADEHQGRFLLLRQLLERLPEQVTPEFHLWRELDPSLARSYFERHQQFVRAHEVGTALRRSMSTHLASYGLSNTIGLVLTWHRGARLLDQLLPKRGLVNQGHNAEALLQLAAEIGENLPGATVLDADCYLERIGQSCDRDGWSAGRRLYYRPEFFINEQAITGKPVLEKGLLRLGDSYTKVMLLYLYPDAWPGMSAELSAFPGQLHISHVLRRTSTRAAMQASEKAENFTKGSTTHTGTEQKDQKVDAEGGFRHTVIANNYQVFTNTYIIHLHHDDPAQLRRDANQLAGQIDRLGGQLRMSDDVQLLFWRFAQPGQGYRASWSRPDHSRQVADMLPVQVYNAGDRDPMMLRLSHTGQLVGMSYHPDQVNHSITAAMTGGGKGVNKVAQILETYPLGIDWYIMEVGTSYQWTVEALGGTYSRIDPGETVVNPLPLYSAAIPDGEGIPRLPIEMITGTVESLAFILTNNLQLTTAQEAVAQSAFSIMYGVEETRHDQPTFETLLDYLQLADNYVNNETELTEAQAMANRLESFLSTAEGRIFARPNNFHLSDGITGVDLLLVRNKARRLLKFYLVFLSLAFAQKAFSSPHRSRVLLDEMHEYVRVAPEVIKPLITGLARMGRKDGGSLDLVTQETAEIDAIERAVINQCPWQTYLYRQADWELIAERTHMRGAALERWKQYPNPIGQPWRPAIQRIGDDYHDLHLTFPEDVLLLASSDKSDLDAKAVISKQTSDPLERIALLRAHRERRHAAA